jgi:hypothetical protein
LSKRIELAAGSVPQFSFAPYEPLRAFARNAFSAMDIFTQRRKDNYQAQKHRN